MRRALSLTQGCGDGGDGETAEGPVDLLHVSRPPVEPPHQEPEQPAGGELHGRLDAPRSAAASRKHRLDVFAHEVEQHPAEHLLDEGRAAIAHHGRVHVAMLPGVGEELAGEREQPLVLRAVLRVRLPLEVLRRKAKCAGVGVRFDQGFADTLPYPDRSFDRVVSSFMFHHLGGDEKAGMLREARRVLKAGGSLHLLDFAGPGSGSDGPVARWVQSRRPLLDNAEDRTVTRMREAGFPNPRRIGSGRVVFGLVPYSCFVAEVGDAS